MDTLEHTIDWQKIGARLRAPFDPADVDFRPQGKPSGNGNVQVVAYVDARTVMARLDEACGPDGWSFTWEPIHIANGQVQIAKGRLTIHGVVREDVGEASNFDPSKGCISDTLKRVAVQFGVARYLYDIERTWVRVNGNSDRLSDEAIARLRAALPRPDGTTPAPVQQTFVAKPKPLQPPPMPQYNDEPATAEQQEQMRRYRAMCKIFDKTVAEADNHLRRKDADDRIAYYEALKHANNGKAEVTR